MPLGGVGSDVWAALVLLASLCGVASHAAFAAVPGPVFVTNSFVGLWLALFNAFAASQALYLRHAKARHGCSLNTELAFFCLTFVATIFHFAGYCMSGRAEGIVWSLLLLVSHVQILLVHFVWRRSEKERDGCGSCCVAALVWTFRVFFLLFLCLTAAGAMFQGIGAVSYPRQGRLVSVAMSDGSGRSQTFNSLCRGPKGSVTVVVDTDASHALPKFYGVQDSLVKLGIRVCIQDKPGTGHASYLLKDQTDFKAVYPNYLKELLKAGEGPFVLAVEGGGAEMGFWIATRHPELPVKGLLLVDGFPSDYEFTAYQHFHNLSDGELQSYREATTAQRKSLAQTILAIGCPWDLMGIFFPPKPKYQKVLADSRYEEYLYNYRVDKTWATQRYVMGAAFLHPQSRYASANLSSSVLLGALVSERSDADIRANVCEKGKLSEKDCQQHLDENAYSIRARVDLVQGLGGRDGKGNATVFPATQEEVNMEWFWLVDPDWTAKAIQKFVAMIK